MKGQQARNVRKEVERLIEKAHQLGISVDMLGDILEDVVNTPELMRQFEVGIRADQHIHTSLIFNETIDRLEFTYMTLANIAVIARTIDVAVLLREKYALLLSAIQGMPEDLEETFTHALIIGSPKHKSILELLRPDIEERIECAKQIVAILSKPKISDQERRDLIQPFIDRIEAVAPRHGQILAQIGSVRQTQDRGGRRKGISDWLRWLLEHWIEVSTKFPELDFTEQIAWIGNELTKLQQVDKSHKILKPKDITAISNALKRVDYDREGLKKYLLNLVSKNK